MMFTKTRKTKAPEISVERWFNTTGPLTLGDLMGRPVLLHTFQMLCPGCVANTLPQMKRVHDLFGKTDLAVLGLHTVFEHHAAMTPVSLEAFIHEYQLRFPIGVDKAGETGALPETMSAYQLRGTPSTVLINRRGEIQADAFGHIDDLALGAMIQSVLLDSDGVLPPPSRWSSPVETDNCDETGCPAKQS